MLYHIFTDSSWGISDSLQNFSSSSPPIHVYLSSSFFIAKPFANFCSPAFLPCPDSLLSLWVILRLTFCIQRPRRTGRSFCLVNLLYHLLITNETQKENVSVSLVGGVHAHAWPLLDLLLVLSFLSEMSLKGVKCLSSFLPASPFMRSILPLHRPAIYDATQELQGRMGREEGNLSFHLLSLHL